MSKRDYVRSQELQSESFEALVMTMMRITCEPILDHLQSLYPEIWEELKARYNAPGGLLPGEEE